jgi:hypothetical protein
VAVLNVEVTVAGENIDSAALADYFLASVDEPGYFRTVGAKEVASMVGFERQKQLVGCGDSHCLAEIGGALGVDLAFFASVGKVGDRYLVAARMVDSGKSKVLGRASVATPAPNGILKALHEATLQSIEAYKGTLSAEAAEKLQAGAQPNPMPPTVNAEVETFAEQLGVTVSAAAMLGYEPSAADQEHGTAGGEIDVGYGFAFGLDLAVGVAIGPSPGARLTATYRVLDKPVRLGVGLRGGYWPGLKVAGGGPLVVGELPLGRYFGVLAQVGAEAYSGGAPSSYSLLAGVGVAAHF